MFIKFHYLELTWLDNALDNATDDALLNSGTSSDEKRQSNNVAFSDPLSSQYIPRKFNVNKVNKRKKLVFFSNAIPAKCSR